MAGKKGGGGGKAANKKAYNAGKKAGMAVAKKKVPQNGRYRTGGYYGRYQGNPGSGKEVKFFDTALNWNFDATMEVAATGVLGQLNLIPQGVTESTRVGRKCVLKSVYIKGNMTLVPTTAATAACAAYVWVILDKQANGALALIADVFTTTDVTTCLHNLANSQRFVVLKKWKRIFNSPAGVTTAFNNVRLDVEKYIKCNIPLEFSSTTGAIGEIKSNNVFCVYGQSGGDDIIQMTGTCRVRFSDGS